MTPTPKPIALDGDALSKERIEQIKAATEGVTAGPWRTWAVEHVYRPGWPEGGNICSVSALRASKEIGYAKPELGDHEPAFNAIHIANCDPQTVAALCNLALSALTPARERTEPVAWRCTGCGAISHNPKGYIALIQKGGGIACCPESNFVPFDTTAPTVIDEGMIDRAAVELLAHGEFGTTDDTNRANARIAARATLLAALTPGDPTP